MTAPGPRRVQGSVEGRPRAGALAPGRIAAHRGLREQTTMQIRYHVSMLEPDRHLYTVVVEISRIDRPAVDLVMPVWTPGSYLIREFPRHVQGFGAQGPQGALPWQKLDKHTWRVTTEGSATLSVSYQ